MSDGPTDRRPAAGVAGARDDLLVKEKELTRALDALAAERRRLPVVRLGVDHQFTAPDGAVVGLAELFAGRRQLVAYHHMLGPGRAGPGRARTGCAWAAPRSPTTWPTRSTSTPATPR